MGIKGEGGHVIGALQDGTPVSIAGALTDTGSIEAGVYRDRIVASTSSIPGIPDVGGMYDEVGFVVSMADTNRQPNKIMAYLTFHK